MLAQTQQSGSGIDSAFMRRKGAAMLDMADAMQQAGCHAAARPLYDDALRTLGAPAYAELRLRAQIAIACITRNAAKWAPAPSQAASAH